MNLVTSFRGRFTTAETWASGHQPHFHGVLSVHCKEQPSLSETPARGSAHKLGLRRPATSGDRVRDKVRKKKMELGRQS